MERHQIVVIGAGPAGLAAAIAAKENGIMDVLVLERDTEAGGILNQCIHNGFGLHTFREELTGPEYAERYVHMAQKADIPILTGTMVTDLSKERVITAMNSIQGCFQIQADAVILAMGCRERPRGALNIPGSRPAGIYTAGCAQRLVNLEGLLPGKEIVILGSGDIGLIMARRLTLEGANVKAVVERLPRPGGLQRNVIQCLEDFDIPLLLSSTVTEIYGKKRVEAVCVATVDADGNPIEETKRRISCDTLLLSVGLIPENELSLLAGLTLNPHTKGPNVNASFRTENPGIFACGNVVRVYDLVDHVSADAAVAGAAAAAYLKGGSSHV